MTSHAPESPTIHRTSRTVLLVDNEPNVLMVVGDLFEQRGWKVISATDGRTGIELYEREQPDLVVLDVAMPGMHGLRVLEILRERDPDATIVMLSGAGDIATAVEAMQLGAENYLVKPLLSAQFTVVVESAYEKTMLKRRNRILATRQVRDASLASLGQSSIMRAVARQIELLAAGNAPILLSGETGSGKGWISKLIHAASPRSGAPFVSLNCAGLTAAFLDTELFGHEKGAFTDAKAQKLV
jgi:DNA-binding NtrC family response regulator